MLCAIGLYMYCRSAIHMTLYIYIYIYLVVYLMWRIIPPERPRT